LNLKIYFVVNGNAQIEEHGYTIFEKLPSSEYLLSEIMEF